MNSDDSGATPEETSEKVSTASSQIADQVKDGGAKRRTKTGCLTCRKRRIKCDEQRPVCRNCIKSKRDCTGYNHTVSGQQNVSSLRGSVSGPPAAMTYAWDLNNGNGIPIFTQYSGTNSAFADATSLVEPIPSQNHRLVWDPSSASPNSRSYNASHQDQGYTDATKSRSSVYPSFTTTTDHNAHLPTLQVQATTWPHQNTEGYTDDLINSASFVLSEPLPANRYGRGGVIDKRSRATLSKTTPGTNVTSDSYPNASHDICNIEDPWYASPDNEEFYSRPRAIPNSQHDSPSGTKPTLYDVNQFNTLAIRKQAFAISPLLDEKCQDIFNHFLSVTGPSMGLFERHDYLGRNGLSKTLWTHDLPRLAFSRPALAHAILAVSAMHMVKLNLIDEASAIKNFTYACRRIGTVLGNPQARLAVSTLATVTLLGYYEVMAGDHSRWNLHLTGAAKLVMEHDFAGTVRLIRKCRAAAISNLARTSSQKSQFSYEEYVRSAGSSQLLLDDDWQADQNFVSVLMGCDINYDIQMQPEHLTRRNFSEVDERHIEDFRILMEVYWWYCKQDVYQSILGGDGLLLPYTQWKYCPPRGPIGDATRAYATMDHLWLLLARIADFSAKDRQRKQKVVTAQGGHWIPSPGFLEPVTPHSPADSTQNTDMERSNPTTPLSSRPSANEGRTRTSRQLPGPPPQPAFYGMLPPPDDNIKMPSSFTAMKAKIHAQSATPPNIPEVTETSDLEAQTQIALEEHASISKAFDSFEAMLGSEFQPLASTDFQIATPFGPALRYQSPTIAAIWVFLNTGRIILRRAHPHSPAASMVSAGVNARMTDQLAQVIGRICGGLFGQHSYLLQTGHVDRLLSAAVMDATVAFFFAAVQYRDPSQREWTIGKLSEIAHVVGWQSAAAIATACETTWEKMGLVGSGPPYHRTLDQNNADVRVSGTYRYVYGLPSANPPPTASMDSDDSRLISHNRNFINKHAGTRVHWALGLMSVEEDLERMALKEEDIT